MNARMVRAVVRATAAGVLLVAALALPVWAQGRSRIHAFVEKHCFDCHDTDSAKGGLDLSRLGLDLGDALTFAAWAKVYDRVQAGEMPPAKRARPGHGERDAFLSAVADPLTATDLAREAAEGRSTRRRLNRYEYENTIRDLLQAPWLQIKDLLPEDGEASRFNKVGDALDVSHVQMAQYLTAAEYAIREVLAAQATRPETKTVRYYARDMKSFASKMMFNEFNHNPARATFPVLGFEGQPAIRAGTVALVRPDTDPATREREGMGVVASAYEPIEPKFDRFKAPRAGRYRVRLSAFSVWVGAAKGPKWWEADLNVVARGQRPEPLIIYSELPPRQLRRLGAFDVGVEPTIGQIDVYLLEGETIRPDPARLFRSRPPNPHNPLADKDGQPGLVYRWLEVEGPLVYEWPPAGRTLLFGDLPINPVEGAARSFEVLAPDPKADARRLMQTFLARAYRRPVDANDVERFVGVAIRALDKGARFLEAMIAGYSAVLCSPRLVYLEEPPGPLDGAALAARLSYFLWNSPPDEALKLAATRGDLARPDLLRAQALRLLDDARAQRFVDAFLDYWLDLRRVGNTSPDAALYPDYYLDDLLLDSATQETQLFVADLLHRDLPARNLVASDFVMVNERLAMHYGLPNLDRLGLGVNLRRVSLPRGSPRGGLLTQASLLKVTANGTTTSPVVRGAWIMERILGQPVPPPPPGVPAVEPDIRGARTIREQLDKHRNDKLCASCHLKIDPAGFALESFDVMGGWRARYRALGEGGKSPPGYGKNGQPFEFHDAQLVDAQGQLPEGSKFRDVVELKRLLLRDERQIARNLVRQLTVFATGAPVRFGDRARVEAILDRASSHRYGVRTLVLALVGSELFSRK